MKELFPDAIILRLAFFFENNLSAAKSVKEGKMYGLSAPDSMSPYMAAYDAGKAAAGTLNIHHIPSNCNTLGQFLRGCNDQKIKKAIFSQYYRGK